MSFAIVADSTCDWSLDEYQGRKVVMVPLTITVDDESFRDQVDITSEEFYERMQAAANLPKTSQPSPNDFIKAYEQLAAEGYEQIISIHIALPLSGTCQSARVAAEQVDIPVAVVDSLGGSASFGLVVERACDLRDQGVAFEEAVKQVEQAAHDTSFYVAPDSLDNLLKGGRLSQDQVNAANMLNIKPMFTFDDEGILVAHSKVKGMKGVLKAYVELISQATEQNGRQRVRFFHSGCLDNVEKARQMLADAGVDYEDAGASLCGATVVTHLGVGALGVAFLPAA